MNQNILRRINSLSFNSKPYRRDSNRRNSNRRNSNRRDSNRRLNNRYKFGNYRHRNNNNNRNRRYKNTRNNNRNRRYKNTRKNNRNNSKKWTTNYTTNSSSYRSVYDSAKDMDLINYKKRIEKEQKLLRALRNLDCNLDYFGCIKPCYWDSKSIIKGKCNKIDEKTFLQQRMKLHPKSSKNERDDLMNHYSKLMEKLNQKDLVAYKNLKDKRKKIVEKLKKLSQEDKDLNYQASNTTSYSEKDRINFLRKNVRQEFKDLEIEIDDIDYKLLKYELN